MSSNNSNNQTPAVEKETPVAPPAPTAAVLSVETERRASGGGATTPIAGNATPTSSQDQHPYQRGSVIEVWHIPAGSSPRAAAAAVGADAWWSEPDSSDEETKGAAVDGLATPATATAATPSTQASIRLCDIIDRAQITATAETSGSLLSAASNWRYYIHYRDFNRRMDEWITTDRILSPPSVGNSKARALKREEERRQREEEEAAAAAALVENSLTRSRRRSAMTPTNDGTEEGGRRTRLSRRKSNISNDDDATVVTGHTEEEDDVHMTDAAYAAALSPSATTTPKKAGSEVLVAADTVTTHTVGEHVVATLQAVELDEHEGLDEASLREHEEVTKVKNVAVVELGYYQMETWYFSPLPKELVGPTGLMEVLYVCEFTLRLFARKVELQRHQSRLPVHARHPPGNEIYRCGNIAMFEVDGLEEKIYSQNLCYLAKLFLDHKTLYFDVDPFLFYVLCEVDDRGFHPVGYYSKEKYSDVGYNLACILTFPAHQRKGYGRFLIAFSYELSKKEEKVGSPEKPMSDLGQQAYKPYWTSTIVDFLLHQSDESSLSVMDVAKRTSIMAEDIVFTLNQLGLLKMMNGVYFIAAEESLLLQLAKKYPIKEPRVDPSCLHWTPFLTDVKRDKFSIHSKKSSVVEGPPSSRSISGANTPVPTSAGGALTSSKNFTEAS